jgi:hypothetical protein
VEDPIEVRYAGVIVGRTTAVRGLDARGAFIGIPEPLPVGTIVTLKLPDGQKEAHVEEVVESADANAVGMRVGFDLGARAPAPAPAPKVEAPAPKVEPAAPVAAATGDSGSQPVAAAADEGSAPLAAPLSLAGPDAHGGKKRNKKRR